MFLQSLSYLKGKFSQTKNVYTSFFFNFLFKWDTHLYIALFCPSVPLSVHPSICMCVLPSVRPSVLCAPYLRNRTLSDHTTWYTSEMAISPFFSFFFFLILRFWIVRVERTKNSPNQKISITSITHDISEIV